MIKFFKTWCEGIIVAVIISIIIESILPEGNTKKYVKVVIGIYIIFTILNPFLGKLNEDIKFENILNIATIQTSTVDTDNIQKLYTNGIEETLKQNIEEEFGYKVKNLEIKYDSEYENIENIVLEIAANGISTVEKVQIGNRIQETQENEEYEKLKKYISENYNIDKSKIIIQG